MAKPEPKVNHGQAVKQVVQEAQAARVDGGHPGIGGQVSAFASQKGEPEPPAPDFADGLVTVVKDEEGGLTQTFGSFAEALEYADDGDTLQVGAGTYAEAINLTKSLTIVGEEGAILDGSGVEPGPTSTVELFGGFTGGSISGLRVIAVQGGSAVESTTGELVSGVTLAGNVFDAGANTAGSLVYLNPGASGFDITGNEFTGASLELSPLLGLDVTNGFGPDDADIDVSGNTFGATPGDYVDIEIFNDVGATEVVIGANTFLGDGDIDRLFY